MLPIGVIVNVSAVLVAGLLGGLVGNKLNKRVTETLNMLMGFIALAIGIVLTIKVQTLGAVALALVLGTLIGSLLKIDEHANHFFTFLIAKINKVEEESDEKVSMFSTLLLLCCLSGTGIFGAINEGLTSDSTVLICKAIMDFTTFFIFASSIGKSCALISIPQAIILLSLFFLAQVVRPLVDDPILKGDFSAVGGIIELMIALRILKVSKFKVMDALPAIILIFPITMLWNYLFQ